MSRSNNNNRGRRGGSSPRGGASGRGSRGEGSSSRRTPSQRPSRPSSRAARAEGRTSRSGRDAVSSYDEARPQRTGRFGLPLGVLVLFALVVVRLVWLQVIEAPSLSAMADSEHTSDVTISARRGTIYDRNGNVLATSVDCTTLYCNPREVGDKSRAASILATALGGSEGDYYDTLSKDTTFAYLKRQADTDAANSATSALSDAGITGVYTIGDVKRVYPNGATGGQVLGFIGTDGHGLSGLELYYDDVLAGTDGTMIMERGADGTPVAGGAYEIHDATDGQDIIVSLDLNVQRVAEEQLMQAVSKAAAKSGNVMVTDPQTGEILAACSTPLFDPTDASTLTNEALKLQNVSDSFEPGSTFKVLTMAIGYDAGVISPSSTFTVPAKVKVGDSYVGDDDGRSYTMDMTPAEIMRRSSNAGAAMVGMAIGADAFSEGIARFGIGQPTGIDFPGESAGIVASRDEYTGATVGSAAFGQGIAFPSVQLVRAVGAVANGGTLLTPHFLVQKGSEKVDWGEGTRVISEQAAAEVTADMVGVVDGGTGTYGKVDGYTVAGKTGTGEQAASTGGYSGGELMSSFVAFADAEGSDAQVLCFVGLAGTVTHGGDVAAPTASAIMGEALSDLGVEGSR